MRIKITAKKQINQCDETERTIGICETDSVNRALQMYEDDLTEDEVLEYEIID